MAIFNRFPFSNAHELNLDWILRQLKDLLRRVKHLEESGGGGGGDPGTTNYNDLSNKPRINNVTLQGNKTSADLNIPTTTTIRTEINHAFQLYDPAEADYAPPYAEGTLGYAIEHAAIDPEDIQDAVDEYLDEHPTVTGTFTNAAKNALLDLLEKVAFSDDTNGQAYWNILKQELFATAVVSISAVFNQGSAVIYDTDSLDVLRQYLTVTAAYSDGTSEEVHAYTLSGSLTEGTSIITVSYGGQTDTISVTVSISLDSIAYGTLTFRQMFITNNEIVMGDFEGVIISSTEKTLNNGGKVKIQAGSPALTTAYCNSPTHSLKCFGSSSTQVRYRHDEKVFNAGDYICCVAVKVDRHSAGNCGMQASLPATSVTESINLTSDAITDGFIAETGILNLPASRTGIRAYIGSYNSADADCYVDDAIFAPAPPGITAEELQSLYETYLELRRS